MTKNPERGRLENDRANARAVADAVRESNPREATRQDNAATGFGAEIDHMGGKDPAEGKTK